MIEKIKHWSAMAKLTDYKESVLSADQLDEIAEYIGALQQKLDAMAAENAALKDLQPTQQMITAAHRELEEYDNIQIDDDAVVFTWQAMRGQQKTPATDAYLNSVRAEGVDIFEGWLRNSADIFDKNGRHEWADKNRVAADKAKEFADSLRSGSHDTADKAG